MDAEERKAELMAENRVQDGMMSNLTLTLVLLGAKSFRTERSRKESGTL